jgi:hypothetical protein
MSADIKKTLAVLLHRYNAYDDLVKSLDGVLKYGDASEYGDKACKILTKVRKTHP